LKSDIAVAGRSVDFAINTQFNYKTERDTFFSNEATSIEDSFVGEFGFPEWQGFISPSLSMDRWRFTWSTQYIDGVEIDLEDQASFGLREDLDDNPLDDVIIPGDRIFDNFTTVGGNTVTCAGPTNGDVNCRPVVEADAYWEHAASIRYRGDDWSIVAGVANVFDTRPPLVDPGSVFSVSNIPVGNGYDLNGREFFLTVNKAFR